MSDFTEAGTKVFQWKRQSEFPLSGQALFVKLYECAADFKTRVLLAVLDSIDRGLRGANTHLFQGLDDLKLGHSLVARLGEV